MGEDIDLAGISVMLAMPVRNHRDITIPTMMSLVGTINELHRYGIPFETCVLLGDTIDHNRSKIAHKFLNTVRADAKAYNRLFFFDSDLEWKPEDAIRLLAYSTEYEVIGAAYRAKKDPPFYLWNPGDNLMADARGCIPVGGMGLGFTCIQRTMIEQLTAKAPVREHTLHNDPVPDVFRFDRMDNGNLRGEDFTFFADVRELGYVPRMDPSIELGHLGDRMFTGKVADILVRAQEAAE